MAERRRRNDHRRGIQAGLFSLALAYAFRQTGSLWFGIGIHAGWDYGESFIFGVPNSALKLEGSVLHPPIARPDWLNGGATGPEGSILAILPTLGLVLVAWRDRTQPRTAGAAAKLCSCWVTRDYVRSGAMGAISREIGYYDMVTRKSTRKLSASKRTKSSQRMHSKRWSAKVARESDALDLRKNVFRLDDPKKIAASLKGSAEHSTRRKADPYRSAMSMLTFYINRAGKNLPAPRKKILNRAKTELRSQFGRG